MYSKRGPEVVKTWSGGKLEVTASNRSAVDKGGSLGQKGLEAEGTHFFHPLNQNLFFLGFYSSEEANWVIENGSRIFRGEVMQLERWTPSTGCTGRKGQELEAWIRVVGLPLHLWIGEILKKVGDSYGGFVALDEETSLRTNLLWVRILVKMNSIGKPSSINLLAGARSYKLQIWWEIQPTVVEVYPRSNRTLGALAEPSEEDDRKTCTDGRVRAERDETRHTSREEQRDVVIMFFWKVVRQQTACPSVRSVV